MLLSEAFEGYARDVIAFRGQSPKTEESHNVCRKDLLRYFGDIDMNGLTVANVRDWKLALDKRVSSGTCREYVIKLRVVLTYLKFMGEPVIDPSLVFVPKRGDRVPAFITAQEVSRLIRAVLKKQRGYPPINRYRNAAIISLLYASGLRVSELASLNRTDIRDDGTFTVIGKGRKARLCFTDARTRLLINDYLKLRTDNNPAMFISNSNDLRIRTAGVQRIFILVSVKSGIAVHPHTLRHSFATNLLRNNANIRYVQALLGHSSLETTQMYTHVVNIDLHKAYEAHHTI